MSLKKKLLIVVLFLAIVVTLVPKSFADYIDAMDFDITINSNGDMTVVEDWTVDKDEDSQTMFKNFVEDERRFSNVTVSRISGHGEAKEFTRVDEYMYHVTPDCYYALTNPDGDFEIAWGANKDQGYDAKYRISYTIKNAVSGYQDCQELYWQFIGKNFELGTSNIEGHIHFPAGISSIEDYRVWAHGPLTGEITKVSNTEVMFTVPKFENFLEVRIAFPPDFLTLSKTEPVEKLDSILDEEIAWADEANRQREAARARMERIKQMSTLGAGALTVIYAIFAFKGYSKLGTMQETKPTVDYKYFRDIPDKAMSPASAAWLVDKQTGFSNAFTGIVMGLAQKKVIEFESDPTDIKNLYMKIKSPDSIKEGTILQNDERRVYEYLKYLVKYSDEPDNRLSTKKFKKYARKAQSMSEELPEKLFKDAKQYCLDKKYYDEKMALEKAGVISKNVFLIIFAVFLTGVLSSGDPKLLIAFGIANVVCFIINLMQVKKISEYTQEGLDMKVQWAGLKKYMEEFSLLKEREVPELALWEQFMVYATAFGIAKKVMKQLKEVYPELVDKDLASQYAVMNAVDSGIGDTISSSVASSVASIAASSNSSGYGGGGGFSGGGGGGGRRWRRRKSLKYKGAIIALFLLQKILLKIKRIEKKSIRE